MLCIPPYEPVHRVAGLYLLYSLYISRPLHCHVRVSYLSSVRMNRPSAWLCPLRTGLSSTLDATIWSVCWAVTTVPQFPWHGSHFCSLVLFKIPASDRSLRFTFSRTERLRHSTQDSFKFKDHVEAVCSFRFITWSKNDGAKRLLAT